MLGKNKLNIIKVLIYKHLTDSYMKKAIKILRQKINMLISKEEFTNTDYERLKKGIELSRKQFERFW